MTLAAPDEEGPQVVDGMTCSHCDYDWVAVHPLCEEVECPRCGQFSRTPWAKENYKWFRKAMS